LGKAGYSKRELKTDIMRLIFCLLAEKSVYISTTDSSTIAKALKDINARSHAFFNIVNQSQRKTITPEFSVINAIKEQKHTNNKKSKC
jgi:hypothetical protein